MQYPEQLFSLKNGHTVLLRSPNASDADAMLTYLKQTSQETEQLLRYVDEWTVATQDEAEYLERILLSPCDLNISAFINDKLVGNVSINALGNFRKIKHRASLGISIIKSHWNLGLGTLLIEEALRTIRTSEITQVELGVFSNNESAIHIYKKLGFHKYGLLPNAFRLQSGSAVNELLMVHTIAPNEKENHMIETERLFLRPWQESDAESLYKYAKDPRVGPSAGWPAHTSIENSREIIRNVLSVPETYAVVLKETCEPIGSIGIKMGINTDLTDRSDEAELGYWLGTPYWGLGLIPEAAYALLRHGFENLGLQAVWCGYFSNNEKSKRVQEKCGFIYHHTNYNQDFPLIDLICDECISLLTKENWLNQTKKHR